MRESTVATAWALVCPDHGKVFLTKEEYFRQMNRGNYPWECPRFVEDPKMMGFCGARSRFDDEHYEDFEQGADGSVSSIEPEKAK